MALIVLGVTSGSPGVATMAIMIGTIGLLIIGFVIADKSTPWSRFLPVAIAPAIAGVLPVYRYFVLGDGRTGLAFLALAGFFAVVVAVTAAAQFMRDRRWVVDTPARRRVLVAGMIAMALGRFSGIDWFGVSWIPACVVFGVMFWPSRASLRRAALPPPSPHLPV